MAKRVPETYEDYLIQKAGGGSMYTGNAYYSDIDHPYREEHAKALREQNIQDAYYNSSQQQKAYYENSWGSFDLDETIKKNDADANLDAISTINPEAKSFSDMVRSDSVLKAQFGAYMKREGEDGLEELEKLFVGEDKITKAEFEKIMADPEKKEKLKTAFAQAAANDADELDGDYVAKQAHAIAEGKTAELSQSEKLDVMMASLIKTDEDWAIYKAKYDAGYWYSDERKRDTIMELAKHKSPDELMDAFEAVSPESKDLIAELRKYPELTDAIKDAVANDPTVLQTLGNAVASGQISPAQMKMALEDPEMRKMLVTVLENVADKKEFTGEELNVVLALAANPNDEEAKKKYSVMAEQMGLPTFDKLIAGIEKTQHDKMMGMVNEFAADPEAFMKNRGDEVMAMFGIDLGLDEMGPTQRKSIENILNILGDIGGPFLQIIAKIIPGAMDAFNDLSGATDAEIAEAKTAEATSAPSGEIYSTPPRTDTASLTGSHGNIVAGLSSLTETFSMAKEAPFEQPPKPANEQTYVYTANGGAGPSATL